MSAITKQWLQQKIADMEAARDEIPFGLDEDDSNTLAALRIALASLEAKSRKLFTCSGCGAEGLDEPLESKCHCNEDGAHWVESVVYTAPPALVSVPLAIHDEDFEKALSVLNGTLDDCGDSERGLLLALDKAGIEVRSDACRAAMLQGAENAETPTTIQTAPALDSSPKIAESTSGNSPVIPDGWVAVPVEPTYQMCKAMGLPWESPRFPDRYKAMISAAKNDR
ncbi:hypothetical protein AWI06_09105 [Enterobacter hormaechei subsp. xiangfangensis]|uniref:hypothetical protein n=1 Tax=Enterobacter hormaechei TaxID=158836 RepID=UPI0007503863|nr:hypothetical protein [Enterobacter hormaechei]KUQ12349.1 hypothetical protein AWI06_09105 [Enterobacter hormaechei subsp. xiangfangensis]